MPLYAERHRQPPNQAKIRGLVLWGAALLCVTFLLRNSIWQRQPQGPASARRELDGEWPLQPHPHGSAAPLGQRSAGDTAVASTLSNSPVGGALAAASASTQEAAEQGDWRGMPLISDSQPALAATRGRHWPRWSHAPGGLAAGGADPDTRSTYPGEASGDPGKLALAGSSWRNSAPLRHPGGAHSGGHQADPGTVGVGNPMFDRTGHAMPLPAEEGLQPEQGYLPMRGSSGGRSGGGAGDSVPSMPGRDAAHGWNGRGQTGGTGRGGPGWEGASVGSADPQGPLSGFLGGMGAGQEEAEEDREAAEQGGPEVQGAARAVNPKGWLFGHGRGAGASAAVGTRGETTEGRYSEVRGAPWTAYPRGRVSGYRGAAGSALEESGANDDMAAGLDTEAGVPRASGFTGRLSRHQSDRGGGDELYSPDDDLPAEDAASAVQGLTAASGASGRLARHRSDRADVLEVSQLEPEAGMEDAEDAEWAAGEADPAVQGLAMLGGASGALAGLSAPDTVSALGRGSANAVDVEGSDLAVENDAEEEDVEVLYPASVSQGGAKGSAGDLWRLRTGTDQGLAMEVPARRDPNPVMGPGADFGGSGRGSSGMEQALANGLQGRMIPGASPSLDPVGRPGRGAEGAPHTELAAANQRVAGVLRAREAAQADARAYNPSRAKTEGTTAAPRTAWWGKRGTAGSAAAEQPRVEAGAGMADGSGRADPRSNGKASSEGAEHQEIWAESTEHGNQHGADPGGVRLSTGMRAPSAPVPDVEGADAESLELGYLHGTYPDGLGVSAGARAPQGPALDVEGADAGVLLDPPDATPPQDENSRRRALVKAAARHSWAGYVKYAFGHDELAPLTRNHSDTFCGVGATLIDTLDTLWLMGMRREFARARDWVADELNPNRDCNVSVFEMTIRGVGGLLAAHDLSGDAVFLERAAELADRLMPAFATRSGLPNSTINLASGASAAMPWANGGAVLSELGSVQLELARPPSLQFKVRLSQATGRPSYGAAAEHIIRFLDTTYRGQGLLTSVINIETGEPWNELRGMGAGSDSYYEYLLKLWLLGGKREPLCRDMWVRAMDDMAAQLVFRSGGQRFLGGRFGENLTTVMEHLACFVPGNLALGVEAGAVSGAKAEAYLALAAELCVACVQMYSQQPTGLAPEVSAVAPGGRLQALPDVAFNILRPEAVESLYMLWRITGEPRFRDMGWRIFQAFDAHCRVDSGGFASIGNVTEVPPHQFNKMESFWLSETLKYLYLLFSPPSALPADVYVLNTEAHPLRVASGAAPAMAPAPAAAAPAFARSALPVAVGLGVI